MKENKMSRRTFEALCLGMCPVIFNDLDSGPSSAAPSVEELNALLLEGFTSVDQPWNSRCEIKSVDNFREHPEVETYAKMLSITDAEFHSGEYRERVRVAGQGAGLVMLEAFNGTPFTKELTVLNGNVAPVIDAVQRFDGGWYVRGYHDFGFRRKDTIQ
jgi:hypothetical protein